MPAVRGRRSRCSGRAWSPTAVATWAVPPVVLHLAPGPAGCTPGSGGEASSRGPPTAREVPHERSDPQHPRPAQVLRSDRDHARRGPRPARRRTACADRPQRRRQVHALPPDLGPPRAERRQIHFDGQRSAGRTPQAINRLGLARSFQITNIFPKLTVFENIRLAVMRPHGLQYTFWKFIDRDRASARRPSGCWSWCACTARAGTSPARWRTPSSARSRSR
jgi:hypothetical protein